MQGVDPRVPIKSRWVAGILASLIPGAGHFYQGRLFKGAIYSVCILGTFCCGMALGNWQTVYTGSYDHSGSRRMRNYGYVAQLMMGFATMPAMIQSRRYSEQLTNIPNFEPTQGHFTGLFLPHGVDEPVEVEGQLQLAPAESKLRGTEFEGTFVCKELLPGRSEFRVSSQNPLQRWDNVDQRLVIEPKIYPAHNRRITCEVHEEAGDEKTIGVIVGSVPRNFWDWFQVPLDDLAQQRLHGELGKQFDLALVYTWIAGLLNVLAVWDAIEGPAYGYGDEEDNENKDSST